jgi:hypothetical protein
VQALESKVLLDTAMSLYGLEHSEMYWEKAQDTKMLISWNKDTIVIAFRGTSSMANALADLQVGADSSTDSPFGAPEAIRDGSCPFASNLCPY